MTIGVSRGDRGTRPLLNFQKKSYIKGKGSVLYSAVSSPLDRSKRFIRFALPGRPVHSDTNSASSGSILVMQQLRATTKSLTCPPLPITRYSFIQLSQQGRQWRERKCPIFDTVAKQDSNPGSLDCESGILSLSYRAPQKVVFYIAQYPVRWTAQSALHFLPRLAHLFIPTPTRLLREAF